MLSEIRKANRITYSEVSLVAAILRSFEFEASAALEAPSISRPLGPPMGRHCIPAALNTSAAAWQVLIAVINYARVNGSLHSYERCLQEVQTAGDNSCCQRSTPAYSWVIVIDHIVLILLRVRLAATISSLLPKVGFNNWQNQSQLSCSSIMNSLPSPRAMHSKIVKKQDDEFAPPHSSQGLTQVAVVLDEQIVQSSAHIQGHWWKAPRIMGNVC